MARLDPHSYADSAQPRARHLTLRLAVDFEARRIEGEAALRFDAPAEGPLDLDTQGARGPRRRRPDAGAAVPFEVGPDEPDPRPRVCG